MQTDIDTHVLTMCMHIFNIIDFNLFLQTTVEDMPIFPTLKVGHVDHLAFV